LFGGTSAAFLLFGFSLLYGLADSTSLPRIAEATARMSLNPLLLLALLMTVVGFGFKVAAAPFHFWAPDVYQGAPAPSAAFIASSSKVAGFFVFFRVLTLGFPTAAGSLALRHPASGWAPIIVIVSVLSMLVGNVAAIAQTSLRRLLAYSAVAHAGYMLLATSAHSNQALAALIYYVLTYALSTLGLFGVIALVERHTGGDTLDHLRGLGRRSPFLAASLAIFVLSLAGIPPLTGFLAKFYLFATVLTAQPQSRVMVGMVVLAIAMSAVSLYYYLRVLKAVYVTEAEGTTPMRSPIPTQLVVALLAAGTIILGIAPRSLLAWILSAVTASR
jgi:NADH-quinone oxidoreductase subunit N